MFGFLLKLRKRPEHERRILAVATYCSIAAIVLALWVSSFRNLVNPGTVALESASPIESVPTENSEPPEKKNLDAAAPKSPFGTLRELLGDTASAITEFRRGVAEIAQAPSGERESATSSPMTLREITVPLKTAPPASTSVDTSSLGATPTIAPPAPKLQPPASPPTRLLPLLIVERMSRSELMRKSPPTPAPRATEFLLGVGALPAASETAKLTANIAQPIPPVPSGKTTSPHWLDVIEYNLAEIGRTAVDVYHYVSGKP